MMVLNMLLYMNLSMFQKMLIRETIRCNNIHIDFSLHGAKNKDWMILTIGAKVNKVNCQYYLKKMSPIIYLYYPFDVPH